MALTEPVEKRNDDILYLSIVAAIFRQKVELNTPGAVARKYKDGDEEKVKFEILHRNLFGKITDMKFETAKFGEQFVLTVENEGKLAKVYMSVKSRYFIDLAKKLPNVDLDENVSLNPYDFEGSKGKQITGITVRQWSNKIGSYYWDGTNTINGAPSAGPDWSSFTKDDWAQFFDGERAFLIEEVKLLAKGLSIPDSTGQSSDTLFVHPAEVIYDTKVDIDKVNIVNKPSLGLDKIL